MITGAIGCIYSAASGDLAPRLLLLVRRGTSLRDIAAPRAPSYAPSMSPAPANPRNVRDAGMELLSDRLARIGSGPVELFSEPDRDRAFPEGPSLWAVGVVPVRGGSLYASYGLSGALDADRAASFELSILVPGPPQPWPALLLRAMAHDMRSSQRDRVIGEIIAFDDAITRCFAAPAERSEYSESKQTVVVLTADPLLSVPGVEIRRVLGLDRSEQRLLESWSLSGFLDILQSMDPTLSTDPARPSLADDHRFVEQIATGSRKEGSAYGLVCVPGYVGRSKATPSASSCPRARTVTICGRWRGRGSRLPATSASSMKIRPCSRTCCCSPASTTQPRLTATRSPSPFPTSRRGSATRV